MSLVSYNAHTAPGGNQNERHQMATTVTPIKPSRTFRPWPENQREFAFAEKLKFNVSELLNEIVAKHLRRHVEHKAAAMHRLTKLTAPKLSTSRARR